MTDSSMDDKATDGGLEMGPSADELFGGAETESLEGEPVDRRPGDGTATVTIEDRTAADVFDELRTEASAGGDVSDLLADESPEDIIASADEPAEPEPDLDDDLTVDDETLGDLLLTDRTEGEEFLWVDAGDADDDAFSAAAIDNPDPDDPFDETADATTDTAADVSSGDAEADAPSDDTEAGGDEGVDASPADPSPSVEAWAAPDGEPVEVGESDADAAADESAADESSPESTDEGPIPLVDPESETDENAARAGSSSSDDEPSFRGGLVTDAPEPTVDADDERPDEDDDAEADDSSDDPDGDDPDLENPDGDERSESTRAADRSADASDDGSSGPLALLAKLPVVGRLF